MSFYNKLKEKTLTYKNKKLFCFLVYLENYNKIKKANNRLLPDVYINWLIDEKNKVLFFNNPKVACTSLMVSMFNCSDIPDDDNYLVQRYIIGTPNNIKQLPTNLNNYYKFGFVRNPFSRLVSFYKNRYENNILKPHKMEPNIPGYIKKVNSFEDLTFKILQMPDFILDPHFALQHPIFYKNNKCLVDFIGKFENIENDYKQIQEKYNYLPLPKYNQTLKNENWKDFYTIKAIENVYKKYKKDIKLFGYEKEYEDLKEYILSKNTK